MGRKAKDLAGQKFGMLTAIAPTDRRSGHSIVWECLCDCGNTAYVSSTNIISKRTQSCGCNRANDLTGQRFGKLTAIASSDRRASGGNIIWACKCDCGSTVNVSSGEIKRGGVTSCGCKNIADITGQQFGKLTAIRATTERRNCSVVWECSCTCGNTKHVASKRLQCGDTTSCGCNSTVNLTGQRVGRLLAVKATRYRRNGRVVWECNCDCGNVAYLSSDGFQSGKTNSCGCLTLVRQPEILGYVQQLLAVVPNVYVYREYTVQKLGKKRFDIAIIKNDIPIAFIEYDGEGHFRPVRFGGMSEKKAKTVYDGTVKSDKEKNKYCSQNNIPLCRIPYTDFDNYKTIIDKFLHRERLL